MLYCNVVHSNFQMVPSVINFPGFNDSTIFSYFLLSLTLHVHNSVPYQTV